MLDYLEGLENAIKGTLGNVSDEIKQNIVGISVDRTGLTLVAVDENGTPLAILTTRFF